MVRRNGGDTKKGEVGSKGIRKQRQQCEKHKYQCVIMVKQEGILFDSRVGCSRGKWVKQWSERNRQKYVENEARQNEELQKTSWVSADREKRQSYTVGERWNERGFMNRENGDGASFVDATVGD